jgi:sugar phosphate permease
MVIVRFGWRAAFVSFGSLGLVWSAVWFWYYRDSPAEHPGVNAAERKLIVTSVGQRKSTDGVPWRRILSSRQMWILSAMYFCYAYSLAVYLDWFPKYLNTERGFSTERMGLYASLPLLAGTFGDIAGGWISDIWARRTSLTAARRGVAVSGFLLGAASILAACFAHDPVEGVYFSCAAMFGLELTVGVSWAIPLDIGGDYAGSVCAVMNSCGNMGGAVSTTISGYLVKYFGWNSIFIVMAVLAVLGAGLFLRIDAEKRIA